MTKPILKGNISLSHEPDEDTVFKDNAEGHASTTDKVFSSSFQYVAFSFGTWRIQVQISPQSLSI